MEDRIKMQRSEIKTGGLQNKGGAPTKTGWYTTLIPPHTTLCKRVGF
jgi:hypothetical protein